MIIKLLKIELIKIKSFTTFWVIIGISALFFLIIPYSISIFDLKFFAGTAEIDIRNYFRFPHIWQTLTWIANWITLLFFSITPIILIGNEFSYKTFRQHLIDGLQRNDLVTGKIIVNVILAILFTCLIFLIGLMMGAIYQKDNTIAEVFMKIHYLGLYFVEAVGYMSLGTLLVFLTRNSTLSIVLYFGYFIFEAIFRTILSIFDFKIFYYFPVKTISNLTPRPSLDIVFSNQLLINPNSINEGLSTSTNLSFALFYIIGFFMLTYWLANKRNF